MDASIIKVGIIENFRHYIGTDCVYSNMFRISESSERNRIIKRMMRDYNVIRGFKKDKQDETIECIINEFSNISSNKNIKEKSIILNMTAESLKSRSYSLVNARSAISKLYWFYSPTDWIMYDRLALRSLRKIHKKTFNSVKFKSDSDFLAYYELLENLDISKTFKGVNDIIAHSHDLFSGLCAERIIDKILMYYSQKNDETTINKYDHRYIVDMYEMKINRNFSKLLDELTTEILDYLPGTPIFRNVIRSSAPARARRPSP